MMTSAPTLARSIGVALAALGLAIAALLAAPPTARGSQALAPLLPDLSPTACTTAPARMGARELRCLVENLGVGDAPSTATAFTIVTVDGQRSQIFLPTPALTAGESTLLRVMIAPSSPFQVVADAGNVAWESTETNNVLGCGTGATNPACPLPES